MKTHLASVAVWKRISIALTALVVICIGGWYVWYLCFSAEQFRDAIVRGDFRRAEKMWRRGARVAAGDPYGEFMRIRDRLQAVNGVEVTEWKLGKLQILNGYFALVDIKAPDAQVVIGLTWESGRWLLKTDAPPVPSYVKQSIEPKGAVKGSN